jgi:hypothetical protein
MRVSIPIALMLLVAAPTVAQAAGSLETLVSWMSGSFSSQAQAEADSNYYDIRLEMAPIWEDEDDEHWLYVEQATASHQDKPYRQRVYRVVFQGGVFHSEVYALPGPERFVGAWKEPARLDTITPDSLAVREGCVVILEWNGEDAYEGSTVDQNCTSQLRGASYATSHVVITDESITSWDQGFDAEGAQVWGATKGGYVFRRVDANESEDR